MQTLKFHHISPLTGHFTESRVRAHLTELEELLKRLEIMFCFT